MNYIDLSYQNTYELFKNNNISNCSNYINDEDDKLIEGYSNFGRVNLEKCCPLGYMWSEGQKKCVKICSGCSTSSYGDINYEFLHNHGDEFMSFHVCKGDATGSYDFNEINKRYDSSELLDQYDMNMHVDFDESASGVQPAEEDPWTPVTGGLYQVSAKQQQMNIRHATTDGDAHTWDNFVSYDEDGVGHSVSGSFVAITDEQRYDLQSGAITAQDLEDLHTLETNRSLFCAALNGNTNSNTAAGDHAENGTNGTNDDLYNRLCTSAATRNAVWISSCSSPHAENGVNGVNGVNSDISDNTLCKLLVKYNGGNSSSTLKVDNLCSDIADGYECPGQTR